MALRTASQRPRALRETTSQMPGPVSGCLNGFWVLLPSAGRGSSTTRARTGGDSSSPNTEATGFPSLSKGNSLLLPTVYGFCGMFVSVVGEVVSAVGFSIPSWDSSSSASWRWMDSSRDCCAKENASTESASPVSGRRFDVSGPGGGVAAGAGPLLPTVIVPLRFGSVGE